MVDLHTHSTFSDGSFTPTELVDKAYKKGIRLLALTDHDNVRGIPEFLNASKKYNDLNVIVGCEVSSNFTEDIPLHILALNIKDMKRISDYARISFDLRHERLKVSIKKLQEEGYDIDYDRDIAKEKFGTITQIENIFLNRNMVADRKEVQSLIMKGGIAYYPVYKFFPNATDTLNAINDSGAISVLAHPNKLKLNDEELEKFVKNLVDNGLQGIECYHSKATLEQTEYYLKLAKKFNLIITGGSDHHGRSYELNKEFGMANQMQQKIPDSIAEYFLKNALI